MVPVPVNPKRKLFVQTLSLCFGFGSWIAMTGLWVELPLLTQKLPEGWALGSYLSVMIQLANVGPLVYWFARKHSLCSEQTAIHVQMAIGTVACVALIFWWDTTMFLLGAERSVVLLLAAFGLSIVDCTSSVAFLPYMARFRAYHMTPYLLGEGLSGFLPSIVALAQGVTDENEACISSVNNSTTQHSVLDTLNSEIPAGREPRFTANVFFCFLLFILLLSWLAFVLMDLLVYSRGERIDLMQHKEPQSGNMFEKELLSNAEASDKKIEEPSASKGKYRWLLGLMCWGCFTTFGAMPALQSYVCLPYGADTYFYAVTLAGLAYPAACLLGLFLDIRWPPLINGLTVFGSGIGVYILVCAAMSPYPPLKTEVSGAVIMAGSWLFYVGIISYMKTMVSLELNDLGGNTAMFWCGLAQQFGAATGGALIFIIINFTSVFKEEKCS